MLYGDQIVNVPDAVTFAVPHGVLALALLTVPMLKGHKRSLAPMSHLLFALKGAPLLLIVSAPLDVGWELRLLALASLAVSEASLADAGIFRCKFVTIIADWPGLGGVLTSSLSGHILIVRIERAKE
jgi:hypothetical protein